MIAALLSAALFMQSAPNADWYVSDTSNNITGEREVYAFQSLLEKTNYLTLTMRCSGGKPKLFVSWEEATLPDTAVISFGAVKGPDDEVADSRFIFEKSSDAVEDGWKTDEGSSAKIIEAIGNSAYLIVTAHGRSTRTASIEVRGTQAAWQRVVRHCPVRKYPIPPA